MNPYSLEENLENFRSSLNIDSEIRWTYKKYFFNLEQNIKTLKNYRGYVAHMTSRFRRLTDN